MLPSLPTGLILLNSRAYWPTLQLLEALHRQGSLRQVLLLHPEYVQDTEALSRFCIRRYGLKPTVIPISSRNPQMGAILQQITRLQPMPRVVNLTGGRKLLFGALLQTFLSAEHTTLLYRHLEQGWLRLVPSPP